MLHIYNRQCNYSSISATKHRPDWFSRANCFKSLLQEKNTWKFQTSLTVLFDGIPNKDHFITPLLDGNELITLNSGSGAKSFIDSVDYILRQNHKNDDIIYLVEDDYLHLPGWRGYLLSGFLFDMGGLHVTLYDHPDKYTLPMYQKLTSSVLKGSLCHWRTTPSTTDTFAVKFSTLKKYRDLYYGYSVMTHYSQDHLRSLEIWKQGGAFISSIPGQCTHIGEYNTPFVNWEMVNDNVQES